MSDSTQYPNISSVTELDKPMRCACGGLTTTAKGDQPFCASCAYAEWIERTGECPHGHKLPALGCTWCH